MITLTTHRFSQVVSLDGTNLTTGSEIRLSVIATTGDLPHLPRLRVEDGHSPLKGGSGEIVCRVSLLDRPKGKFRLARLILEESSDWDSEVRSISFRGYRNMADDGKRPETASNRSIIITISSPSELPKLPLEVTSRIVEFVFAQCDGSYRSQWTGAHEYDDSQEEAARRDASFWLLRGVSHDWKNACDRILCRDLVRCPPGPVELLLRRPDDHGRWVRKLDLAPIVNATFSTMSTYPVSSRSPPRPSCYPSTNSSVDPDKPTALAPAASVEDQGRPLLGWRWSLDALGACQGLTHLTLGISRPANKFQTVQLVNSMKALWALEHLVIGRHFGRETDTLTNPWCYSDLAGGFPYWKHLRNLKMLHFERSTERVRLPGHEMRIRQLEVVDSALLDDEFDHLLTASKGVLEGLTLYRVSHLTGTGVIESLRKYGASLLEIKIQLPDIEASSSFPFSSTSLPYPGDNIPSICLRLRTLELKGPHLTSHKILCDVWMDSARAHLRWLYLDGACITPHALLAASKSPEVRKKVFKLVLSNPVTSDEVWTKGETERLMLSMKNQYSKQPVPCIEEAAEELRDETTSKGVWWVERSAASSSSSQEDFWQHPAKLHLTDEELQDLLDEGWEIGGEAEEIGKPVFLPTRTSCGHGRWLIPCRTHRITVTEIWI